MASRSIPWARILIEGVVIVVSILLAFGIDAWWETRQDHVRGQAYLALVASDIHSTLENNRRWSATAEVEDPAAARFVRAYYAQDLPRADSLTTWLDAAFARWVVQPRLGTAEALIASGDLALIGDDSLQAAITDYVTSMRFFDTEQRDNSRAIEAERKELSRMVDLTQVRLTVSEFPAGSLRPLLPLEDPLSEFPAGSIRPLPPLKIHDVVRDPDVHTILSHVLQLKRENRRWRDAMRRLSEDLLVQIEEALAMQP